MKSLLHKYSKYNSNIFLCFLSCSLFLCFLVSLDYVNNSFFSHMITKAYSINSNATTNTTSTLQTHIADYTLLVYMIGSDFESKNYSASQDIEEMKKAAGSSNFNII